MSITVDRQGEPHAVSRLLLDHIGETIAIVDGGGARPNVVTRNGFGPFDPDELVRWADLYGHPEEWAQTAQRLHRKVESLEAKLAAT